VEIFDILGAAFPPAVPIEVKFCTAKQTNVPVCPAKFDVNRCNESPLLGEKPDFWPVSKFNTCSLPLRSILPVKKYHIFAPAAGKHYAIFPKLCMVIELVMPIKKGASIFLSNAQFFLQGAWKKLD